uniref:Uncharacterized protein n=1 Tax=Amphimedon queenslandica TaxID=400682 RepID=A0A1X7VUD3_AMPQE
MSDRGGKGRSRGRGRGRGSSVGRGRSNAGRDSTRNDTPPVGGLSSRPSETETPHSVGQVKQSNPKGTPTSPPSVTKPEPTAPAVPLTPKRESNGPVTQGSPNNSPSSGSPSSTSSPSSSCIGSSIMSSPQSLYSASPITVSGTSSSSKLDSPHPSFKYRDPPPRPGVGTLGRPIVLQTNHFPIKFPTKGELYHYDVTLKPDTCPRRINRAVIKEIEKKYRENLQGILLAYDGTKNIYTSKPLPFRSKEFLVPLKLDEKDKEKKFEVIIKVVGSIPLDVLSQLSTVHTTQSSDVQSAIQGLDIVLRTLPSMSFVTVGRSFFTPPVTGRGHPLGGGREAWTGYYQSVRPSMGWTITLNLDVSNTAFYKEQPVLEFLKEVINDGGRGGGGGGRGGGRGGGGGGRGGGRGGGGRGRGGGGGGRRDYLDEDSIRQLPCPSSLTDAQRRQFAKDIKGLKVKVTHLAYPRKYKVKDITQKSSRDLFFDCDGQQTSVVDYFKSKHGKPLRYPDLPCLHMEGKNPHIYIPMEYCEVLGQKCNKKLTPEQTSAMIRHTAKPAYERQKQIMEKIHGAHFDGDEYLKNFGIKVSKRMSEVAGRVLDPPKMEVGEKRSVEPRNGSWDTRGKSFWHGISIKKWGIITARYFNDINVFASELSKASNEKRMRMPPPIEIYTFKPRDDLEHILRTKFAGCDIVIVILDGKQKPTYNEVKRVGDNTVGIRTQCVLFKNACKPNTATMSNICLKINSKLGGTNSIPNYEKTDYAFPWESSPFIIFGADVTHPAPNDKRSPSLAAVTASMDENAMDYRAKVKVLKHRQEVFKIDELAGIVKEMLLKFYRKNDKCKPQRIIFYRDGVSEGQFKEVILNEVAAIQKACLSLPGDYKPGITFLVVQKRHHTRLFCTDRRDQEGKAGNVPPGTTVDTDITHPREFDFFLCSHAGIQGTSKPAHYHVLWDDNRFSADELQALTYKLCHCFVRCNRSVSYPAPTYYSHLAAFRARYTLQDWEEKSSYHSDTDSSFSYSSEDILSDVSKMEEAIKVNEFLQDSMYYV